MTTDQNDEKRNREYIYSVFTGLTAIIAELCELLISNGVCDRTDIVNRLERLRSMASSQSGNVGAAAPITHLIDIIKSMEKSNYVKN